MKCHPGVSFYFLKYIFNYDTDVMYVKHAVQTACHLLN